jgi:hypothetical protein
MVVLFEDGLFVAEAVAVAPRLSGNRPWLRSPASASSEPIAPRS